MASFDAEQSSNAAAGQRVALALAYVLRASVAACASASLTSAAFPSYGRFRSHVGEVGRCRAPPLDHPGQKLGISPCALVRGKPSAG
jgi:hypothetical protein